MTITQTFPTPESGTSIVLDDVTWEDYEKLLAEIGEGRTRVTFDSGRMELMSPSPRHDDVKKITARLIETYALECDIPITGWGSTTFRRKDLRKGLEPDECYYVSTPAPPS